MQDYASPTCLTPGQPLRKTKFSPAEIHTALIEQLAVVVDDFVVNKETGEIMGEYIRTPATYTQSRPLQHRAPDEVLSVDEWEAYISEHVDRRKLPANTTHALYDAQDMALGVRFRNGASYLISKPMMTLLLRLHELVRYRNVIVASITSISKHLGVAESNLSAKLAKLVEAKLIKVFTSRNGGMRMGEIKILIQPKLMFRGSDSLKDSAINSWYRDQIHIDSQSTGEPAAPSKVAA